MKLSKKQAEEVLTEVKTRFQHCQDWEAYARTNYLFDMLFNDADAINKNQWDSSIREVRGNAGLPMPVHNKVRQHTLSVVNDARQNKPGVEVRAVGGGATVAAAEIFEGIVRHIESISNATDAYDTATNNMVVSGIGWWKIDTEYSSDTDFTQEIKIERISDSLAVYIDPNCTQYDKSDARFGIVFKDWPKDEFDIEYPKYKDVAATTTTLDEDFRSWWTEDHVRVADYYRRVEKVETLHQMPDGSTVMESGAKADGTWDFVKDSVVQSRDISVWTVEKYTIAGNEIVDHGVWPGKYIPLICCIGEETVIQGRMDRKGLVRGMIDDQRGLNWSSAKGLEYLNNQTKISWLVTPEAVDGHTEDWANANTQNKPVLQYNAFDEQGRPIPVPEKAPTPTYAPGYKDLYMISENGMAMTSGQYGPTFGEPTNERSGKAINERQRAGSNQTYHYIDHLAKAIRFTGRQLIDLIPKIYTTERVVKILGRDGMTMSVQVDPNHPDAHSEVDGIDNESLGDPNQVAMIFNPGVGYYDVVADIGPNYATRRQEEFNAIGDILAKDPSLMSVFGDQWFLNADFPGSQLLAKRVRAIIPPHILGQGPSQEVQQLQQHLAQQHQVIEQLGQQNKQLEDKFMLELKQKQIDQQNADTNQMKAAAVIDPEAAKVIFREMMSAELPIHINEAIQAHSIEQALLLKLLNEVNPQGDQTAQGGAPPNQLPPDPNQEQQGTEPQQ